MDIGKLFEAYLEDFYRRKSNQLSFSNETIPNRIVRFTIDLSENLNDQFRKYSVPMKGLHVERIYQTSNPTIDVTGSLKWVPDYQSIGNTRNYKLLQPNDSFTLDQVISQFFLSWDVQSDVSVSLVCFIDLDYRAGAASTSIVGTVSAEITNICGNEVPVKFCDLPVGERENIIVSSVSNTTLFTSNADIDSYNEGNIYIYGDGAIAGLAALVKLDGSPIAVIGSGIQNNYLVIPVTFPYNTVIAIDITAIVAGNLYATYSGVRKYV